MIRLVERPEVTVSQSVKPVYRSLPLPGDSDEVFDAYRRDWGKPVDMQVSGMMRLSVRLDIEFDKASQASVDRLRLALRDVIRETEGVTDAPVF